MRMFIEPSAKHRKVARLTHSLYTTKIARVRCYRTKYYKEIRHTISAYIKCQDVQHATSRRGGMGWLSGLPDWVRFPTQSGNPSCSVLTNWTGNLTQSGNPVGYAESRSILNR